MQHTHTHTQRKMDRIEKQQNNDGLIGRTQREQKINAKITQLFIKNRTQIIQLS